MNRRWVHVSIGLMLSWLGMWQGVFLILITFKAPTDAWNEYVTAALIATLLWASVQVAAKAGA